MVIGRLSARQGSKAPPGAVSGFRLRRLVVRSEKRD